MPFVRRIKKPSGVYLALVESRWEKGRPRQHVVKYLGKEVEGRAVRRVSSDGVKVTSVRRHLDVEIIDHLASDLGLKPLLPSSVLVLVYSQLLERPSINRMEGWLNETDMLEVLGIERITTADLYNALDELQLSDFSKVEQTLAGYLSRYEGDGVAARRSLVIDVTDTYFEGDGMDEGEAPRRGKDGKVGRLVQIALAVTEKRGFPIFHRLFGGNISGKRLFREMLHLLASMGYDGIVMDRGLYSAANIDSALSLGLSMICGVVKDKHFRPMLIGIDKERLYRKENRITLRNTHVYATSIEHKNGKLIVVYNPYLEVLKREHHYDEGGDDEGASILGYSLIYHNTTLDEAEVVRRYFEKDIVERSFKQMKGVLSLRPVRVWLKSHVEAHVKICYLAYAVLSLLQFRISRLGISAADALDILSTGYRVELRDGSTGFEWRTIVELTKDQERIRNLVYKTR